MVMGYPMGETSYRRNVGFPGIGTGSLAPRTRASTRKDAVRLRGGGVWTWGHGSRGGEEGLYKN